MNAARRPILFLLVALQSAIVVTGGAVRLTGSGLGCPTWPQCSGASYAPVPHQAQGQLHAWIEFGNRLITVLLVLVILAAVAGAVWWSRNYEKSERKKIRLLALAQLLGIVGQIVVGGITVLTHLNPFAVASHFLLSIAVIAGALSLRNRVLQSPRIAIAAPSRQLSQAILALTAFVITLGTVVTGSGPHAGDITAKRFPIDARIISWLHADSVIALISLSLGLLLLLKVQKVDSTIRYKYTVFIAIALGQGIIGYTQYFTKLPVILVAAHLLGATLLWLSLCDAAYSSHTLTSIFHKSSNAPTERQSARNGDNNE